MCRILIVDDMAIFRDPIAACLRAKGFDVCCAANGLEGLEIVRAQPIDLILLDVGMPVMDGFTFAQRLKDDASIASKPPIIVLTAMSKPECAKTAASLGIVESMLKSRFSLKYLVERVRFHLAANEPAPA